MASSRVNLRSLTTLAVVAAVVPLAFVSGGYSDLAVGSVAVIVWLAVVARVLGGGAAMDGIRSSFGWAAVALLALLVLTAASLGWSSSDEAGFADAVRLAGYLGAFVLAGLVVGRGRGQAALAGVAVAGVIVGVVAVGSRLVGVGAGDAELVGSLLSASGRLSYPIGYWNALGSLMAIVVPVLVWAAAEAKARALRSLAIAAIAPVLLTTYMTSSRGALLAALIGVAVAINFARDRGRSIAAFAVGVVATLPAVVAATLASGILDSAGDGGLGGAELAVGAALLLGMLFAASVGDRIGARLARVRIPGPRLRARYLAAAVVVVAAGLVAVAGPSALVGDFRSVPEGKREGKSGFVSVTGSGRAQFWGTALEAFADEPLKGIGAGGFASYWSRNGTLDTPARNAHSEPLEQLAELGMAGFACFASFIVLVLLAGVRRARPPGGSPAGAALGLIVAGLVGFLIDWTWQVPAVSVPILIVAATLAGSGFDPAVKEGAGRRSRRSIFPLPAFSLGTIAVLAAVPIIWAGGVLTLTSTRLDASAEALGRGELAEAAAAARSAAAIEPWAAEPWLRLAEIEQAAGNFQAAQLDVAEAIRRAPEDFGGWKLAAAVQLQLKNFKVAIAYTQRGLTLAPLLFGRGVTVTLSGARSGT